MKKVCVIGLGTIGYPAALHIKEKSFQVIGVDVRSLIIKEFPTTTAVAQSDIYVICVNTKNVTDVCANISPGSLVFIESTVPVGLCRSLAEKHDLKIAHCPHRYWVGGQKNHGIQQLRVLGAVDKDTLSQAKTFYNELSIPVNTVSNIEAAELSKLTENTYRFVEIAFAEELRIVCEDLSLDFEEVRRASNTKWNVNILEARDGIGGTCLPKDTNIFLKLTGRNHFLVEGAAKMDAMYKKWVSQKKPHY